MSSYTSFNCSKLWLDCYDYKCDTHYMKLCPKGPEVFNSVFGRLYPNWTDETITDKDISIGKQSLPRDGDVQLSSKTEDSRKPSNQSEDEVFCSAGHQYCIEIEQIIKSRLNMNHCSDCKVDEELIPFSLLPEVENFLPDLESNLE